MKQQIGNLTKLQAELNSIIAEAVEGKLTKQQAADKITELKEKMDLIVKNLKIKV
jgi:hypothetical protein